VDDEIGAPACLGIFSLPKVVLLAAGEERPRVVGTRPRFAHEEALRLWP
jgi:hypothetical protein